MPRNEAETAATDVERESSPDPEAVLERVRERGEAIRDREVRRALSRLRAHGDLSEGQRRAVEEMADGIVGTLLSAPTEAVSEGVDRDERVLRTAVRLFDPDEK